MRDCAWLSLTPREQVILQNALLAYAGAEPTEASEIGLLAAKLRRSELYSAITIGVHAFELILLVARAAEKNLPLADCEETDRCFAVRNSGNRPSLVPIFPSTPARFARDFRRATEFLQSPAS